jgi:hypothetical protein
LCGAETWILQTADQKYLESWKCGAGERHRDQLDKKHITLEFVYDMKQLNIT